MGTLKSSGSNDSRDRSKITPPQGEHVSAVATNEMLRPGMDRTTSAGSRNSDDQKERTLRGQARVLEVITSGTAIDRFLLEICNLVEAIDPKVISGVHIVDNGGKALSRTVGPRLPQTLVDACREWPLGHPERAGNCTIAIESGGPVACFDADTDRSWSPAFKAIATSHGVKAMLSIPLFRHDGVALGSIFAALTEPAPDVSVWNMHVINIAAKLVGLALERERSMQQLRELYETLEQQVAERTADRDRIWQLTNDIMLVARFDATVTAINPAWQKTLEWREDEVIGRSLMNLVHPDDRTVTNAEMLRLKQGMPTRAFQNRLRHKNGSFRNISWTAVPDRSCVHAIGRDLTIYIEQQKRLEQAQRELRQAQKMELLGQLTGCVAHDFNNLLGVILNANFLLSRPDLPEDYRRHCSETVSNTVGRAAKLTGQLLAFARQQPLNAVVLDVWERLRTIADMIRTIVGTQITTEILSLSERCLAKADVIQFETALINMVVNARDAMSGRGRLTITVACVPELPPIRNQQRSAGDFIAVSITDTGTGIPPDKLARIFEPFFTTKEIGKGTGLGLSQVFGFARQSGGDISVESQVGQGSTFTLYLPQVKQAVADVAPYGIGQQESASAGMALRVLLVEDNIEMGKSSTHVLNNLGHITTWVTNAEDALNLLGDTCRNFDLVFSDVAMPSMNGIELAEEIRRRFPQMPVVLASGHIHAAWEDSGNGFALLLKPYSVAKLSEIFQNAVAGEKVALFPQNPQK